MEKIKRETEDQRKSEKERKRDGEEEGKDEGLGTRTGVWKRYEKRRIKKKGKQGVRGRM